MPTEENGPGGKTIRYNTADPADLALLIENGAIWQAGPQSQQAAVDALVAGTVPLNDLVPPVVRAAVERAQSSAK